MFNLVYNSYRYNKNIDWIQHAHNIGDDGIDHVIKTTYNNIRAVFLQLGGKLSQSQHLNRYTYDAALIASCRYLSGLSIIPSVHDSFIEREGIKYRIDEILDYSNRAYLNVFYFNLRREDTVN